MAKRHEELVVMRPDGTCYICHQGYRDYGAVCRECYERLTYMECQRRVFTSDNDAVRHLPVMERH